MRSNHQFAINKNIIYDFIIEISMRERTDPYPFFTIADATVDQILVRKIK